MEKIIERVDKLLAENKAEKDQADATVQDRVDLLANLIERAKKNQVAIKITCRLDKVMEITPQKIECRDFVRQYWAKSHDTALRLARCDPLGNNIIASILFAVLRGNVEEVIII